MAERDRFELDLAAALRAYAVDAPTEVRPAELARQFAVAYPHRRIPVSRGRFGLTPALAWVLLAAGLLVVLLAATAFVGARRPDRAVVIAPSPAPTPAATVAAGEGTDILATTKAKALPAQATCPAGSNPDALGPGDQERPSARDAGAMAFDRHAGRIVLLADDYELGPRTWTYDVCTNTWRRMNPPEEPLWSSTTLEPATLVYDADSDRTLAFTSTGRIWSYNLAADRWTREGWFPDTRNGAAVYHDPSGLLIVYEGGPMSAYDVDTDTMTAVHQLPDPSQPAGSRLPNGGVAYAYDPGHDLVIAAAAGPENTPADIWTFAPATGAWRLEPAQVPADLAWWYRGWWSAPGNRLVFDDASGLAVFVSHAVLVGAYDAGQRTWRILRSVDEAATPGDAGFCDSALPVYDPIDARIVCRAQGTGVSAFSTTTGQWRWLLEPLPESTPAP
jgi:hypothetical protein